MLGDDISQDGLSAVGRTRHEEILRPADGHGRAEPEERWNCACTMWGDADSLSGQA